MRSTQLTIPKATRGARRKTTSMMPPRFPVTASEIGAVVQDFYTRIRKDPVLGPVFAAHVQDWPAHEDKIASFWRNAILFERSYDGNPMQRHLAAGNVRAEMFARWLELFDETLAAQLDPDAAAAWSALARKIGRGLAMGVADRDAKGPPKLL